MHLDRGAATLEVGCDGLESSHLEEMVRNGEVG